MKTVKHDYAEQEWPKDREQEWDAFEKRMNIAIAVIGVIGWVFLAIRVAARLSQ